MDEIENCHHPKTKIERVDVGYWGSSSDGSPKYYEHWDDAEVCTVCGAIIHTLSELRSEEYDQIS